MTWAEPIPLRPDSDDAAPHIVEMMAGRDDDVDVLDVVAVRLLISQARLAHRRCLSAWLLSIALDSPHGVCGNIP